MTNPTKKNLDTQTKIVVVASMVGIIGVSLLVKRHINAKTAVAANDAVATWMELNANAGFGVAVLPMSVINNVNQNTGDAFKLVAA